MKTLIISLMLAGLFPASTLAQTSIPGSVTSQVSSTPPCRAGTLDLRAKSPKSLDTTQDSCQYLYAQGYAYNANDFYQEAYDTLMIFIDRCANYPKSWQAFQQMNGAVGALYHDDTALVHLYQLWLESVLYLNTTDPEYFCSCVEAIGTNWYGTADTSRQEAVITGINQSLAVVQWLLLNTNCDPGTLKQEYTQGRQGQYQDWYNDSVRGVHYNLDTTLPTMQQLGLDTILDRHFLYSVSEQPVSILINATASPNPVSTGTIITFGLAQEAYVKIGLFDILGLDVISPGFEGLFAPSNHEVPLSLSNLPSGTYFARILTAYGNVATVKLVKEQ